MKITVLIFLLLAVLLVVALFAYRDSSRKRQRRAAGWRAFISRQRALRDLAHILWGPPKLTDQRENGSASTPDPVQPVQAAKLTPAHSNQRNSGAIE